MGLIFTQSITVTTPNGGEPLTRGNNFSISWTSSGVSGNVNLILWKGSSNLGQITQNKPANGSFSWHVGDALVSPPGTTYPNGTDFKIMVKSINNWKISDKSNANFTISTPGPGASITIASPNGGEPLIRGSNFSISWTSSGVSGNINLILWKGNSNLGQIAQNKPANGSFSWHVGDALVSPPGITYPNGTDFKIMVKSINNWKISDKSNGNFSISQNNPMIEVKNFNNREVIGRMPDIGMVKPAITPYLPKKGDILNQKTNYEIKWKVTGMMNSKVNIHAIYPVKGWIYTVALGVTNNGYHYWKLSSSAWNPGNYKIKITTIDNGVTGLGEIFNIAPD